MGFSAQPFFFFMCLGPLVCAVSLFLTSQELTSQASKTLAAKKVPHLFFLTALFALAVFGCATLRAHESAVLANFFLVSSTTAGWTQVFALCGLASLLIFFYLKVSLVFNTPEAAPMLLTLIFCWTVALCARSFFGYLLFLEIAGLCLLYFLLFFPQSSPLAENGATAQAALTFLWVSVFALLGVLWALFLWQTSLPLANGDAALLVFYGRPPANSFGHVLLLALSLKLMVLPWQGLLLSFYKQLNLKTLLFYGIFYYPPFLLTALPVFASLASSAPLALTAVSLFVLISPLTLPGQATNAVDLRGVLAVSSIFNVILLFTSFLL